MQEKISEQKIYIEKVRKLNEGKNLKYIVLTMGCQLNENDSEKISGMLEEMGYSKTDKIEDANVVAFNTCCVRENAEDRLFGKLGEVKKYKETNGTIIAIGGCMMLYMLCTERLYSLHCVPTGKYFRRITGKTVYR